MTHEHERLMRETIALAVQARGRTRPNPLVGCVVARSGEVIARGYHRRAGEAHAEIDALAKLGPGEAHGADLYVNLEPCCTHGRTPPCTDAILASGIARVFVGTTDTNPRHRGAGLAALRDAGVEVIVGVLEDESRRLNAPYFSTMERGRPLVAAKWAMSLDGKIATRTGDSAWITNEASRAHVHTLRAEYDAVLVGTRTLLADDPRLTCRAEGGRDPVRVVIDAELRAAASSRVFDLPGTIVAHDRSVTDFAAFAARGAVSLPVGTDAHGLALGELLAGLRDHDVMSVLVEGGGAILGSLFDAKLVDRVYAFVSPRVIGGRNAVPAVAGEGVSKILESLKLVDTQVERFGEDLMIAGDVESCLPDS